MLFVPKNGGNYRDVLEQANMEKVFSFDDFKILPTEQIDSLLRVLNHNSKKNRYSNKYNNQHTNESQLKNQLANTIISKVQDPRLKNKGKINSLVLSTGGSQTTSDKNENAMLSRTGSKVMYTVIEINGIVVIEPIGQPGNATYIAEYQEDLEKILQQTGRESVLENDSIFKITHDAPKDSTKIGLYDYSANHLIDILEYMIEEPQQLLDTLKSVKKDQKYCTLKTLVSRMPSTTKTIIRKVKHAAKEYGITASEALMYSFNGNVTQASELNGIEDADVVCDALEL